MNTNTSVDSVNLQELSTKATKEIVDCLMDHFKGSANDTSYRRAMFRQTDYGCTMVIDVHLIDGDQSAHIITRFGRA